MKNVYVSPMHTHTHNQLVTARVHSGPDKGKAIEHFIVPMSMAPEEYTAGISIDAWQSYKFPKRRVDTKRNIVYYVQRIDDVLRFKQDWFEKECPGTPTEFPDLWSFYLHIQYDYKRKIYL